MYVCMYVADQGHCCQSRFYLRNWDFWATSNIHTVLTYIHTYSTYIHTYFYIYSLYIVYNFTHTYIHTYMDLHSLKYTYIHTYMLIRNWRLAWQSSLPWSNAVMRNGMHWTRSWRNRHNKSYHCNMKFKPNQPGVHNILPHTYIHTYNTIQNSLHTYIHTYMHTYIQYIHTVHIYNLWIFHIHTVYTFVIIHT